MTKEQLREWRMFADLEPFDGRREDIRNAHVVQAIVNVNRNAKKNPKGFPLTDFVLQFGDATFPRKEATTWQDMKTIARQMVAGSGPNTKGGRNKSSRK